MKKIPIIFLCLLCSTHFIFAQDTTRDNRMKWWREARFGMFIHWGVYSVPAGTYKGQRINRIGEWIMNRGKIPVAEYQQFAKEFNPVKYDAEAWVQLASIIGAFSVPFPEKSNCWSFHSMSFRITLSPGIKCSAANSAAEETLYSFADTKE